MSPIVKRKGEKFTLSSKYLLFILTFLCTILMLITFGTTAFNKPLNSAVGVVVVPFQQGITRMGHWLSNRSSELVEIRSLLDENERLKEQVAALTEENTLLNQNQYELNRLRKLIDLDDEYNAYEKVGARIIGRESGNWYSSFVIDKGYDDGLDIDMNVIAEGGLVGRITTLGNNWARVTSIISDNCNVSAMTLATQDNMIVSGSLQLYSEGVISFGQLVDSKDKVEIGSKVVTSNISDKYLPGILIGFINEINLDNNNLTKSGILTPAVDFEHLNEVLVIKQLKQQISEGEME